LNSPADLAPEIARAGVRHAFGIPGSGGSLELIDALEAAGVAFYTSHHEGAAAIMAGAAGRLGDAPGVAVSIKGPGFANMAAGLAACRFDDLPLVAVAEAYPADTDWRLRHKGMDQAGLAGAVTKGVGGLNGGNPFAAAADLATAEAPGPVLLELNDRAAIEPPGSADRPAADDVISRAESASTPIVIAGSLAARRGWRQALDRLQVPVFSTAAAKGMVNETLDHAAGVYTGVGGERTPETKLIAQADLIVCLGLRAQEVLAVSDFAGRAVNVDDLPGDAPFKFAAECGADGGDEVLAALGDKSWGVGETRAIQADLTEFMMQGFLPGAALAAIARRFGGAARAVFDTGYFCTIAEHAWQAATPDHCLMSGQGRYMGTAVPMAIGAALQNQDMPTVCVVGDGGIGMWAAELKLAVAQKLPLLVVLMTDGGFGSVRTRALNDGLTQSPLLSAQPSWLGAMDALGLPGEICHSEATFAEALAAWPPANGPAYLELPFEPDAYQAMVEGIR